MHLRWAHIEDTETQQGGHDMTNRADVQAKFDDKIASLTIDAAIECYTMLRQAFFAAQAAGKKADRAMGQAMVMTGEALEKIIGEDLMDSLMDEIDGTAA
jgi:hypothetical protein